MFLVTKQHLQYEELHKNCIKMHFVSSLSQPFNYEIQAKVTGQENVLGSCIYYSFPIKVITKKASQLAKTQCDVFTFVNMKHSNICIHIRGIRKIYFFVLICLIRKCWFIFLIGSS